MSRTFKLVKATTEEYEGEEQVEVTETLAVEVKQGKDDEKILWHPIYTLEKYASEADYLAGKKSEPKKSWAGNVLTDGGANRNMTLLTGGAATPLDAANAKIAVGDSSTAASAGQTALQGTNTLSKAMDGGYPTVSGRTITLKSSFAAGEANFEWREWGLMINTLLVNRKTGTFGIKLSGAIWVATATVTI